mgnify:CR=1 FL=1
MLDTLVCLNMANVTVDTSGVFQVFSPRASFGAVKVNGFSLCNSRLTSWDAIPLSYLMIPFRVIAKQFQF